ncbi:hypothetical protein [Streptomyces bicolor]|uniref:hypothetical protein n=1 Tax=Streptomyces bicolor TaxID=66874 RepID=UPI0004E0ED2E|nr:hypothetical protein [Streptomyces bicolor]
MASVSHARSASPVARATRSIPCRNRSSASSARLPLAFGLSGLGLPGVCLALALAMGVQCAAVLVPLRRGRRQEGRDVSLARVA